MGHFSKKDDDWELRYRELRQEFQRIVIAHAAVVYRHTTAEQNALITEEWKALIERNGWRDLFHNRLPELAREHADTSAR